MFGSSYLNHLDMNTHFKVFASYNILQYMCDFIHVLIFVTVSKCRKSPKLANIVIDLQLRLETYRSHLAITNSKQRNVRNVSNRNAMFTGYSTSIAYFYLLCSAYCPALASAFVNWSKGIGIQCFDTLAFSCLNFTKYHI